MQDFAALAEGKGDAQSTGGSSNESGSDTGTEVTGRGRSGRGRKRVRQAGTPSSAADDGDRGQDGASESGGGRGARRRQNPQNTERNRRRRNIVANRRRSLYRGVHPTGTTSWTVHHRNKHIGTFQSEEEAAKAYDSAVRRHAEDQGKDLKSVDKFCNFPLHGERAFALGEKLKSTAGEGALAEALANAPPEVAAAAAPESTEPPVRTRSGRAVARPKRGTARAAARAGANDAGMVPPAPGTALGSHSRRGGSGAAPRAGSGDAAMSSPEGQDRAVEALAALSSHAIDYISPGVSTDSSTPSSNTTGQVAPPSLNLSHMRYNELPAPGTQVPVAGRFAAQARPGISAPPIPGPMGVARTFSAVSACSEVNSPIPGSVWGNDVAAAAVAEAMSGATHKPGLWLNTSSANLRSNSAPGMYGMQLTTAGQAAGGSDTPQLGHPGTPSAAQVAASSTLSSALPGGGHVAHHASVSSVGGLGGFAPGRSSAPQTLSEKLKQSTTRPSGSPSSGGSAAGAETLLSLTTPRASSNPANTDTGTPVVAATVGLLPSTAPLSRQQQQRAVTRWHRAGETRVQPKQVNS